MRLHSVSLYNNDADVLWLSEGALGPDEHNVVVEAIEHLKKEKGTLYEEFGMEDGRIAIFLGIRGPRGDLVGTVMILADMKSLSDGTMERVLTVPVKTLMQKMAVFLRKQYPQAAGSDTGLVAQIPPPPAAAEAKGAAPAVPVAAATPKNLAPQGETLAPKQVDAILTLELVAEPAPQAAEKPKGPVPVAAPARAPAAAPIAARPAPIVKAVPKKTQPQPAAKGPAAVPPRVQSVPPIAAPAPSRDIEVLAFDADISITQARRALPMSSAPAGTAPDVEVLAFDANIQIPTAHPAPAASAPVADIEVLDFDAELTMPPTRVKVTAADLPVAKAAPILEPPVAKAAPAPKMAPALVEPPIAKAAPAAARAEPPVAKVASINDTHRSKVAPASEAVGRFAPVAEPPIAKAAPAHMEPPVAKVAPVDAPPAKSSAKAPVAPIVEAKPAAAPATHKSASTPATSLKSTAPATVSVPVINPGSTTTSARAPKSADEEVLLIQDTGPVKKLELRDATNVEPPLPPMPPPPPLTAEETATDLSLFVQELIKLRSNGRTRRYEVLARSQRDAHRNEVPTAFIAETAKGREGAALDALVVERLLQWLGKHGETIWDSEPASFSVNLSVGALEDEQFPEKIGNWLKQYNVEAEYVGFEVSEFACVQSRLAVQRFVEAVEKLGCFLVIDNFSFDSNMFEFLGSKALRHVKIDPKLTAAAMKEKLPQALVVAILQACKVLGVHCVAKRIESQSSLQWLTAVGCDFAQSFQLEKPTAIDTLVSGKAIKALRE